MVMIISQEHIPIYIPRTYPHLYPKNISPFISQEHIPIHPDLYVGYFVINQLSEMILQVALLVSWISLEIPWMFHWKSHVYTIICNISHEYSL